MTSTPPSPASRRPTAPVPLKLAAALVGLEALFLVGYGLVLIPAVHTQRLAMGVTTPIFFLVYGAALGYGAWSVVRLHSWARAPLVLAQLIQLGVAWSFRGGTSTLVTVALAVLAVVVLVGIFHPASLQALAEDRSAD